MDEKEVNCIDSYRKPVRNWEEITGSDRNRFSSVKFTRKGQCKATQENKLNCKVINCEQIPSSDRNIYSSVKFMRKCTCGNTPMHEKEELNDIYSCRILRRSKERSYTAEVTLPSVKQRQKQTMIVLPLWMTLVMMLSSLGAAAAYTSNVIINKPIFVPSNFSTCSNGSEYPTYGNVMRWPTPSHVAVSLPQHDWDTFTVSVTDSITGATTSALTFLCEDDLDGYYPYHVACISDSTVCNRTQNHSKVYATLPHSNWFSISIYEDKEALLFVVESRQGQNTWEYIQVTMRFPVTAGNWNSTYKITVSKPLDEPHAFVDLKCLQGNNWKDDKSSKYFPSAASTSPIVSSKDGSNFDLNSNWFNVPLYIVVVIAVCGVLVLVLGLLFGLWYWQRKRLTFSRTSFQNKILQRQLKDEIRQRQLDRMQPDLSDYDHQRRHQTHSNKKPRNKPKTYVKPPKSERQNSSNLTESVGYVTGTDVNVNYQEYANLPKSSSRNHSPTSQHADSFSNSEESSMRRLIDEGGITGPYWFHSSRTPDPKTALRIYSV